MCRGFGQPAWAEETILDSHQGGEDKIKERESRAPGREREKEGLMRGSDTRSRPDRQRAEQSHLEPWHGRHLRVRGLSDTGPFPALWARPAWEKKEPFPLPRSLARPGVMGTRVAGAMSLHLSNSLVSRKEAFLPHLHSKEATRYQGH